MNEYTVNKKRAVLSRVLYVLHIMAICSIAAPSLVKCQAPPISTIHVTRLIKECGWNYYFPVSNDQHKVMHGCIHLEE